VRIIYLLRQGLTFNMASFDFIERYRPYWISIAQRITGSFEDAEDAVQNALARWWASENDSIEHVKAYITKSVVTQALNAKDWMQLRRTEVFDSVTDYAHSDRIQLLKEYEQEITEWLVAMAHKLTPIEQGVLLLKDVLSFEYDDIAEIYNRNADYCRQIISRARQRLQSDQIRFNKPNLDITYLQACLSQAIERGVTEPLVEFLERNGRAGLA